MLTELWESLLSYFIFIFLDPWLGSAALFVLFEIIGSFFKVFMRESTFPRHVSVDICEYRFAEGLVFGCSVASHGTLRHLFKTLLAPDIAALLGSFLWRWCRVVNCKGSAQNSCDIDFWTLNGGYIVSGIIRRSWLNKYHSALSISWMACEVRFLALCWYLKQVRILYLVELLVV